MEISVRIAIGPSSFSHHIKKELVLQVPDESVEDFDQLKAGIKLAESNLKKMVHDINIPEVAEIIRRKRERAVVKKEVEAELEKELQASYRYTSEIEELKKEIKKRDCRMDGIIASRNPKYVPPNEDGEVKELL